MKTLNGWVIALATLLMLFAPWAFAQVGPGIMGPVSGGFTGGTVPNATTFSGNVRIDGTLDQRGAISNGGSGNCNYAGYAGYVCVGGAADEPVAIRGVATATTTSSQALNLFHVGGGRTGISFSYNGTTPNSTLSTDSDDMTIYGDADTDQIFQPGGSTKVTFEDFGEVRIHVNATGGVTAGDCDADAEVGRIRRYSKDANNITLCGCRKVGGVFAWTSIITGGDCT